MQDDSQAAAKWRCGMKRAIFRIVNDLKKSGPMPKIFCIEEYPNEGPFLSRQEAEAWIELHAFVPARVCTIVERTASGSLNDVLRFVIAYADGALGDAPSPSSYEAFAVRERLRKAERVLRQVEEVLEGEVT